MTWWEWLVHLGAVGGTGALLWYYRHLALESAQSAQAQGALAEVRGIRLRALEATLLARDGADHRKDADAAATAATAGSALGFLRESFRSSSS